jgi:hypothetical protein
MIESIEDYHADTDWHTASMYKAMLKGPRNFEHRVINKVKSKAPALQLGSLVHAMALEPDTIGKDYVVAPVSDRRTTAYKQWKAELDGKATIVTEAEMESGKHCVDALRRNPIIAGLLDADGDVEHSHRWQDDTADGPCKCKMRADKVLAEGTAIMDIKTIRELGSERDVMQTFWNYGYHIQAAHYAIGCCDRFGLSSPEKMLFVFAYVETSAPYRSLAYALDPDSLSRSIEQRVLLQQEVMRRMKSGDYAEPNEDQLIYISLPEAITK